MKKTKIKSSKKLENEIQKDLAKVVSDKDKEQLEKFLAEEDLVLFKLPNYNNPSLGQNPPNSNSDLNKDLEDLNSDQKTKTIEGIEE